MFVLSVKSVVRCHNSDDKDGKYLTLSDKNCLVVNFRVFYPLTNQKYNIVFVIYFDSTLVHDKTVIFFVVISFEFVVLLRVNVYTVLLI